MGECTANFAGVADKLERALERLSIGSEVKICLNCGDEGFTSAYVYCGKCLEVAVHRYCLKKVTFKELVYWVCDDCEVKEADELNIEKSDAISLEDGNCTSSQHCKTNSKAKVDVPDTILKSCEGTLQRHRQSRAGIDLAEHCQLAGDTPGVKMSKKKSNTTSRRDEKFEQRLVRSSSEQSHESHSRIECNERTQLANVTRLPAKPSEEEVTGSLAKLAREQFIQPDTQRDSSGMIEKRSSISPSGNHYEKESMLGKDRRSPQIRTVVNGDPSSFLQVELLNVPKHGDQERAKPLIDFIWRGSFNIWNKECETFDIVAHLSVKACQKAFEEASLFPPSLQLEILPKSEIWPNSFTTSEPTDDNIALYFFPSNTRCEKEFDLLVEQMIKDEHALRATLTNAELLVFTSTELPLIYWRFQGKYYLWGVFRAKRDSSRGPMTPDGRNKSVRHPNRNEKAVRDVVNVETWDVESPLSPLSNSAGLGFGTS